MYNKMVVNELCKRIKDLPQSDFNVIEEFIENEKYNRDKQYQKIAKELGIDLK